MPSFGVNKHPRCVGWQAWGVQGTANGNHSTAPCEELVTDTPGFHLRAAALTPWRIFTRSVPAAGSAATTLSVPAGGKQDNGRVENNNIYWLLHPV